MGTPRHTLHFNRSARDTSVHLSTGIEVLITLALEYPQVWSSNDSSDFLAFGKCFCISFGIWAISLWGSEYFAWSVLGVVCAVCSAFVFVDTASWVCVEEKLFLGDLCRLYVHISHSDECG
jgi:hypothetical protein